MNSSVQISKGAVASPICGMAFFIPLFTSILAIGLGFSARHSIENSGGSLIGKGIAAIGIAVGSVQGAVWVLILFFGMIFVV